MKDGFVRVATATPSLRVADPAYNLQQMLAVAEQAAAADCGVLVFPELAITAYTCADLFHQPTLLQAAEAALRSYIQATEALPLLSFVGLPCSFGGALYNCAAAVCGGRLLGLVPKTNLPCRGELAEARYFAPAPAANRFVHFAGQDTVFGSRLLFCCEELPGLRVAAELCEDLWAPLPPSCAHAVAGASLIVNLSAGSELIGKSDYRRQLVATQSSRLLCAYLLASAGEGESGTDLVFSGHSLIAQMGSILSERRPFAKAPLLMAELDLDFIDTERRRNTAFTVGAVAEYEEIFFSLPLRDLSLLTPPARTPFVPQDEATLRERCRLILEAQSVALAGRIERAHASCAVLGLSGGLDSTLALLVAHRAFARLGLDTCRILAVTMPCYGTTARTKNNAVQLAEALGVTLRCIDIRAAVDRHFADIGHDPENHNVVYENAQARERTQVLMDLANAEGGLVIGTGDLSELALGWATYNGDHMSMYGVNASVPKTLLRHLVSYVADLEEQNGRSTVALVLRDVLATPVSPELLPPKDGEIAQCTEGIVGPYELHDFFLYHLVRRACPPRKILRLAEAAFAGSYDRATILAWLRVFVRRFFTQQFKRSCLPDGPKVGSVSLSPRGDWQMPSDATVTLWLQQLQEE